MKNSLTKEDVKISSSADQGFFLNGEEIPTTQINTSMALAHLLMNGVVKVRDFYGSMMAQDISIIIPVGSYFTEGSDGVLSVLPEHIEHLYMLWELDQEYGAIAWCISRIGKLPTNRIALTMVERGWKVEELASTSSLDIRRKLDQLRIDPKAFTTNA